MGGEAGGQTSRAQKLAKSLELALTEVLYPPKVDQKLSIGGLRES